MITGAIAQTLKKSEVDDRFIDADTLAKVVTIGYVTFNFFRAIDLVVNCPRIDEEAHNRIGNRIKVLKNLGAVTSLLSVGTLVGLFANTRTIRATAAVFAPIISASTVFSAYLYTRTVKNANNMQQATIAPTNQSPPLYPTLPGH